MNLDITYHAAQNRIFFQSTARRRVIHKGRRLGLTRGAAQAFIEWMLEDPGHYMWGDTINSNIDRYVQRYFLPVLKQLPSHLYSWSKQAKELRVNQSTMDFRSADCPENWEGFGYKAIFLNEAGVILKNEYLWDNAVQPMLLDYPDSICIIGGTPKGKNKFWELAQLGYSAQYKDWESMCFSTYDNPFLSRPEIDRLAEEIPEDVRRQEIFGEFLDTSEHQYIPYDVARDAQLRELPDGEWAWSRPVLGVDVARYGDDSTVICLRQGRKMHWQRVYSQLSTTEVASMVAAECRKQRIAAVFVDEVGVGAGVVDRLKQLGFNNIYGVNVGEKAGEDRKYYNKRAEVWGEMREWLTTADIPDDRGLLNDLCAPYYSYDNKERIKLEKKEDMKKRGATSPDRGDALALTFTMPVYDPVPAKDLCPPAEAYY